MQQSFKQAVTNTGEYQKKIYELTNEYNPDYIKEFVSLPSFASLCQYIALNVPYTTIGMPHRIYMALVNNETEQMTWGVVQRVCSLTLSMFTNTQITNSIGNAIYFDTIKVFEQINVFVAEVEAKAFVHAENILSARNKIKIS